MIFDFTTSAPKPHDLETALQLIAELWINGAKLTAELTALKEKLNTNPTNSSLPPSTDVFGKHKKKIKLHKRKSGLKQGAQVGHVGKGRKILPNEDRGRERLSPSPPSEPGVQFSRDGLSSQLFPHRDWRANLWASDIVNSPRSAKKAFTSFNPCL